MRDKHCGIDMAVFLRKLEYGFEQNMLCIANIMLAELVFSRPRVARVTTTLNTAGLKVNRCKLLQLPQARRFTFASILSSILSTPEPQHSNGLRTTASALLDAKHCIDHYVTDARYYSLP